MLDVTYALMISEMCVPSSRIMWSGSWRRRRTESMQPDPGAVLWKEKSKKKHKLEIAEKLPIEVEFCPPPADV